MRIINFNINNTNKKNKKVNKKENKEKILLTYHSCIDEIPEYYTYIDNDNEVKFTDSSYIISKISSSKYLAKKNIVNKVSLKFIPAKKNIEYQEPYFTYNGNIYKKDIFYNEDKNTYIGIIENSVLDYTKVVLFEE